MEQSGIKEILNALKLHSAHFDEKLDKMQSKLENRIESLENRFDNLESRMDERFDRIESKLNGLRTELTETQETVDYLAIKSAQHENRLREIIRERE